MILSYSQYKSYIECPKKYFNEVHGVEPSEKPSAYFSLYGKLIEMFFKTYTNVIVKNQTELTDFMVDKILRKMWENILDTNYVVWNDPWVKESSEQIYNSVYNDVLKNIQAFSFWKHARSEVSINIVLKKTFDTLNCRLDFLINNPDGTVEILDGKGTSKIGKPDIEQLYFYILMYLLHNKKLPDKAGFLYYRYQTINYINFDMQTIVDYKNKLSIVKKAIKEDKTFQPKVGISKQCKWCAYEHNCEALIAKRKLKSEKKKPALPFEFNGGVLSFSPRGLEIL